MKTKEEIEHLAEQEFGLNERNIDEFNAYKKGYIQCLKDIRKDWQNYTISEKSDFIEFLNKKD
jgi:hypothetical protein